MDSMHKKEEFYDAIIIGAGPAGASAANELVKRGCKVLVIEERKLPRYKMCSGLIMDRAQDLVLAKFGPAPSDVFCRPKALKGMRYFTAVNDSGDLPQEKPEIWNVWRSSFDHWLVKESGADLLESHRLIGLTQTDDAVQATVQGPEKRPVKVNAAYLIGCDGGHSAVRRLIAPAFEEKVHYFPCIQVYCVGMIDLEPDYFYIWLDPSLGVFYSWLHIKDDYIVYGVNCAAHKSIQNLLKIFTDYLGDHYKLKVEKVERKVGCVITDMPAKKNFFLGDGRVLLAGEAAGFVNLFGEGIGPALATGAIAGWAAFKAKSSGKKVLPIYAHEVENEEKLVAESWAQAGTLLKK